MASELVCDLDGNRSGVTTREAPIEPKVTVGGKTVHLCIAIKAEAGQDICDRCLAEALRIVAKEIHPRGRNKPAPAAGKRKKKKTEEDGEA